MHKADSIKYLRNRNFIVNRSSRVTGSIVFHQQQNLLLKLHIF